MRIYRLRYLEPKKRWDNDQDREHFFRMEKLAGANVAQVYLTREAAERAKVQVNAAAERNHLHGGPKVEIAAYDLVEAAE